MADKTTEEIEKIWGDIRNAGSRDAYIERKLGEQGLLVPRRDASLMSKRELGEYKKKLKAEAERFVHAVPPCVPGRGAPLGGTTCELQRECVRGPRGVQVEEGGREMHN